MFSCLNSKRYKITMFGFLFWIPSSIHPWLIKGARGVKEGFFDTHMFDCDIVESDFKLMSRYCVPFKNKIQWKCLNPIILTAKV